MELQNINKAEIQGTVGSVQFREIQGKSFARMTVATNCVFRNNGETIIETTWHNLAVWESKRISRETLESIAKGTAIHAKGRIHNIRYTTPTGEDRREVEIIVSELDVPEGKIGLYGQED